jgi:hypothetical protein
MGLFSTFWLISARRRLWFASVQRLKQSDVGAATVDRAGSSLSSSPLHALAPALATASGWQAMP